MSHPRIPVLQPPPKPIRRSRSSARRAIVLGLVQLIMIVHFAQWWITGSSLSPVEPSESMETLETGRVNAGFIFFAVALGVTLIFGRFVCGWGCHWLLFQDLCGWLMRKLGLKPKPFGSRILLWVPLIVAVYMFIWPRVFMWWNGIPTPQTTNHLMTSDFWRTFPGPIMAVLTVLIAGFAIVYFLGNKGFCTYACPYGGFFGLLDKVSPARIRVTDACAGCGHCTATCTSNVRVHEQVRDFGMVVDPGCMKTLDCVSVCPQGALYYGFGVPAVWAGKLKRALPRRSRLRYVGWEEAVLALLFAFAFFAVRGLYEVIPLLASLGFAGIFSYLGITALRLCYQKNVRIHGFVIKQAGRIQTRGWVFAVAVMLLCGLLAHCGAVQYHTRRGLRAYDRIGTAPESPEEDGASAMRDTAALRQELTSSMAHLQWVRRWALINTVTVSMKLGWLHAIAGKPDEAERYFREAIRMKPREAPPHYVLGNLLMERGDVAGAADEYEEAIALDPDFVEARHNLAGLLMLSRQPTMAIPQYREVVRLMPSDPEAKTKLGIALAATGQAQEAIVELREAIQIRPTFADAHYQLSLIYGSLGQASLARNHLDKACWLNARFCDPAPAGQ